MNPAGRVERVPAETGEPLIRSVLGEDWDRLAAPLKAHFNVGFSVGCKPSIRVEGRMDEVAHHSIGRLLFPLLGLFGVLVPYQGRDVPFSVLYTVDGDYLYWHREFRFPGKRPYLFRSRMCFEAPGFGIEYVRFGIGIRMHIYFDAEGEEKALVFEDAGYLLKLGRWRLPLPVGWLLGHARVAEWVEEGVLHMKMTLEHPCLGRLFTYRGTFRILG